MSRKNSGSTILSGLICATIILTILGPVKSSGDGPANRDTIPWPLAPQDAPHNIVHYYGDWNGPHRQWGGGKGFHAGIDMPADSGDSVYCVKSGIVTWEFDYGSGDRGFVVSDRPDAETGWLYQHVIPNDRVRKDSIVVAGTAIAIVDTRPSPSFAHLHFQHSRRDSVEYHKIAFSNPLEHLTPPLTQQAPVIDSIYFVRNKTDRSDTIFVLQSKNSLYGDIDIIAQAHTDIVPSPPDSSWRSGIYKIGFSVDGRGYSNGIPFRTLVEFKGIISHTRTTEDPTDSTNYTLVYRGLGRFLNHYIVTNSRDTIVGENGFDSIKENMWDTDAAFGDTSAYPEPWHRDGPYTVTVTAWDHPSRILSTPPKMDSVEVMLDNHVPVVRRVVIQQAGGVIYDSEEGIDFPGFPDSQLFFHIYFSESMKPDTTTFVSYILDSFPNNADTLTEAGWDTTYSPNDTWMGYATPDTLQIGVNRLNVQAWDLHGHELDSLISTIAYRDSIGTWHDYEPGPDKNHTFTISRVEGVYIVDHGNTRIQMFDTTGNYIGSFGDSTHIPSPYDIAVDGSKNSYVADDKSSNRAIKKFDSTGTFVGQSDTFFNSIIGVTTDNDSIYITTGDSVWILGTSDLEIDSSWVPSLGDPEGIDYHFATNTLYIIRNDFDDLILAAYTPAGELRDSVLVYDAQAYSSPTTDNSKVYVPVSIDDVSDVYIITFDLDLNTLDSIPIDTIPPLYEEILGIAVDNKHIYISRANHTITFLNKATYAVDTIFGDSGSGQGEFLGPRGIAVYIPSQTLLANSPPSDISFTNSQMGEIGKRRSFPHVFGLSQNTPNPFYQTTRIAYQLPKTSSVTLKIYSVAGQLVRTLVQEEKTPGFYSAEWYGKDETGRQVPSGVYFYHLDAGNFTATKKLILLR